MLLPQLNEPDLHIFRLLDASSPWHCQTLRFAPLSRCSEKKALISGNRLVTLLQLCESWRLQTKISDMSNSSERPMASWEQLVMAMIALCPPLYTVRHTTSDKARTWPDSKMSHAAPKSGQRRSQIALCISDSDLEIGYEVWTCNSAPS